MSDDTVVVEDGNAIGREPDVALESAGAEPERELERFDRIVGGVGTRPPMAERDRRIEERWESLLHSGESWQARRLPMVFNLQGSEVIVILLLALVVLGPEKLPDAIRKFSRTYGELKKMGSGFSSEFKSAIDEPMREMRETGDLIRNAADPSTYVDKAPTAPTSDAPLTPAPVDDAAGVAAGAATAGTADEAPGTADDASGTANEAPGTVGDPPGTADAAGAVDGAPGAADDRVDSADPSDPGSTTIATPGDPPTPSGPPRNLIEARRDGKLTPVDGVAADGAAADGVAAASEVTGGGSPNGEAPEGVAVSGAEAIDEAATA